MNKFSYSFATVTVLPTCSKHSANQQDLLFKINQIIKTTKKQKETLIVSTPSIPRRFISFVPPRLLFTIRAEGGSTGLGRGSGVSLGLPCAGENDESDTALVRAIYIFINTHICV